MNPNQNQNQPPETQAPSPQPEPVQLPPQPPEQPQPQPYQPVPPVYAQQQDNPGQVFGILSIVMIFVFPLLGIVFGALSRSKSKAANMPTGLGTAGLIVNIIITVISTLVVGLFILLAIIGAAASTDTATDSDSSVFESTVSTTSTDSSTSGTTTSTSSNPDLGALAKRVKTYAEAYKAKAGDYPKNTDDFADYAESALPADVKSKVYSSYLIMSTSLTYIYCGAGSAQVVYLGNSKEDKRITALGTASTTEVCAKQY